MNTGNRIKYLSEALDNWLSGDNEWLAGAVERTAGEGFFAAGDIRHALDVLRETCGEKALREWAGRAGLDSGQEGSGRLTLCLHAGNLPLVGFQDALAVLLSGRRYSGKISRKDPYLLPTFLNEVKKTNGWNDRDVQWTHRLDDFEGMPHEAVLFAGSERSVPPVRRAVDRLELAERDARMLIRTAHFSMAWVDRRDRGTLEALTEAVLRYGGKGCRSVAVVVAPFGLEEAAGKLKEHFETFWQANPQHENPPPALRYRKAYNTAVERQQVWLEDFLLQEGGLELDRDFICYWVKGDESSAAELAASFGGRLQSLYVSRDGAEIPGQEHRTERLSDAQAPPIHWRPDGTDTLEWLLAGE